MQTPSTRGLFVALGLAIGSAHVSAATLDEVLNGDLSDNGLQPTTLVLQQGSNVVRGSFGQSAVPDVHDLDYLTIVVPAGSQVSLTLLDLLAGGANSFLGVQAGPAVTMPPTSFDPSPLLGWAHIYSNQQGTSLFAAMGLGETLPAGTYSFWLNETDTSQRWSYALDFEVSAVPEPAALPMWLAGLLAAGLWQSRRLNAARNAG